MWFGDEPNEIYKAYNTLCLKGECEVSIYTNKKLYYNKLRLVYVNNNSTNYLI